MNEGDESKRVLIYSGPGKKPVMESIEETREKVSLIKWLTNFLTGNVKPSDSSTDSSAISKTSDTISKL